MSNNSNSQISAQSLAFIAICGEYFKSIMAPQHEFVEPMDFVKQMLYLLPRLYITATDLSNLDGGADNDDFDSMYFDSSSAQQMDEDAYEAIRQSVATLLGEKDTYLEVFEQDMKYSDTPIAATISENLADLAQVCFNVLASAQDMPTEAIENSLTQTYDDFKSYWSQTLCNVQRALNQIMYA